MKRFFPFMLTSMIAFQIFVLSGIVYSEEGSKDKTPKSSKTLGKSSALLDINQIECYVQNNGTVGENPITGGDGFYFPKGQRTLSIIYTSGLWVIGKVGEELRSAVSCYGSEFQPGSILSPGIPDDRLDPKYKVYKYNKGDIIDAEAINQGCPDSVLGDQMLFCVYNDIKDHSGIWGSLPIGIEVQQTAFAFDRVGPLGQTVFVKYHVVNKSDQPLEDTYLSMFFDPDLGFASDDYTGCDTILGMGYVYNGDSYDEKYGPVVPAMGCDLLQGAIVDAPGEVAVLPDGTELVDKKILGMTAYYAYIGGSPIAGMSDPHTPQGGYYFCSGFLGNGDEWIDPTAGNTPTKFPFAGDPVTETGWIFSSISSPSDIRFGVSSGPVDLEVGESQDLILGLVVGYGGDNLGSILAMRYNDQTVKKAYEVNFNLGSPPPAPVLQIAELDREIVLYWDDTAVDFEKGGYAFEGYNIYQGESAGGPWIRLATFDLINGIRRIKDIIYNEATDDMAELTVQYGTDSGLSFKFYVEKDHLKNEPLINGRPYYFAVTAYSYNSEGIPHALENDKQAVTTIPQRPVLDVEYNSEIGNEIPVTHEGPSQGVVRVEIVDPSILTGDDYEVRFFIEDDTGSVHFGETGWELVNTTTGELVLVNQYYQSTSNFRIQTGNGWVNDNNFLPTDGFIVKVGARTSGIEAFIQVANPTYPEPMPDEQLDGPGRPYGGNNVWHSVSCPDDQNHNGRYFWSCQSDDKQLGIRNVEGDLTQGHDYEIRWKDGVIEYSWGEWGFEDGNFDKVPFELWDIGFVTPHDNSDDERMIPILFSAGTTTVWDVPSGNMTDNYQGFACSDRIYFTYPDSDFAYYDFHTAAEAGNYATADSMWGDRTCPIHQIVVVNHTHEYTGPAPAAGSIDRILTNKPNSPMDVFSFSTKDYAPTKSTEVAKDRLKDINLFPNPYFGQNSLETDFYAQFVTFNNLPEECTIRVFSLSGVLVKTIRHNNGTPFERWYLKNESELPVASGMYIIHVQTAFGNRILKFAFINREARYQHL